MIICGPDENTHDVRLDVSPKMASIIAVFVTSVLGLFCIKLSDVLHRCKWLASCLYLRIFKRLRKNRLDFYDVEAEDKPEKLGFVTHPTEIQLESPCDESHLAKADDKIFCYGVNSKNECLVVNINRLSDGKAEASIYLRLADGRSYQLDNTLDFQQTVGEKNVFSCGGLQMYYLCPMRRWRIFYSGFLKETSSDSPDAHKMTYVKFSLLWTASSDVYDGTADMNDSNLVDAVARAKWISSKPPVDKLFSALDFYAQTGVIMGTVCVDDTLEDYEIYLFGERMRHLGDASFLPETEFSTMLGYVHRNGTFVHIGNLSATGVAEQLAYGFVVKPTGQMLSFEKVDLLEKTTDTEGLGELKGSFVAGDRAYAFCGSLLGSILQTNSPERYTTVSEVQFYLNGKKGTGIYIEGKLLGAAPSRVLDVLPPTTIPERMHPMVVTFTEELCQLPEITGGKGSSLGRLTHLSEELQSFTVPSGMVVTTSSYQEFTSQDILDEIKHLEDVLYGNVEGDVKEACKRVHSKIVSSKVPNNIRDNIVKNLKKIFGEKYPLKKFAVRSSATGEDTEQMSAAGQMDTFLGVSGLSNILLAVKKCWASQFGFTAVQYKRRYGQPLNTPMAVVVQEMVQCDVAGVLFTCDPMTGNPTRMSIAANYGLGESVVSGSEEPDTIELTRDFKNELEVHQVTIGSKSRKIIVTDDGTGLDDISESERQKCCLSTENALRLGKLAVAIEKHYRSRRDIEWGIQNNTIFIFQSRPVTSGTQETDFEIEHELDGPLRVENDHFSVSNTGEVMPGATSTFSLDMFFRMFNIVTLKQKDNMWLVPVKAKYFLLGWTRMCNHAMFNIADTFRSSDSKNSNHLMKAMMVSFFGRVLDQKEPFEVAAERYGDDQPQTNALKQILMVAKVMFLAGHTLKKAQKLYVNYRIPVEKYRTSKELFNAICRSCCDLYEAMNSLMACSQGSTMWNMQILSTLSKAKDDLDEDVYVDFANIVTNKGGVESADVPATIQSLAFHIAKSINPEQFKKMTTEEALRWLSTTSSSAGIKFKDFINKHGHRCLKEFDVHSITWGTDPRPLVRLLQNLAGLVSEDSTDVTNTSILKVIQQLKVPTGILAKLKLLLLVPMSRKGVRERESSKSLFIKGIDAWRKAYRTLAKLMVSEGRIPNEDILYFMTVDDVRELLETRSPRILAKAYHRQRLHPKMDGYIYPEIIKGVAKPINDIADVKPEEGLFSMKGLPVSQGVVKGYVRVATNLNDAAGLKPGEILLAYSTDIGWTPYFPTLAGVATELGGLISHGAVVSREYGLPCVAGLHGATRRFQTGDYVLLDGNKGILQKLQPPEE